MLSEHGGWDEEVQYQFELDYHWVTQQRIIISPTLAVPDYYVCCDWYRDAESSCPCRVLQYERQIE